ncbi:DUF4253 domain-containing protein [Zavarzinia compransoris]|nr:DUF4253 domain-containing protein [Zavarzinia compransoris]TDP46214.1 uncharacterized protein DUF4253 [Zavarzinia compransoris]
MAMAVSASPLGLHSARGEAGVPGFPFDIVEVPRAGAIAAWEGLRSAGRGYPLIVGKRAEAVRMAENLFSSPPRHSTAEVLALAAGIDFPADFVAYRQGRDAEAQAWFEEFTREHPEIMQNPEITPPLPPSSGDGIILRPWQDGMVWDAERPMGTWPAQPGTMGPWFVETDEACCGDTVVIAFIPVADWTEVPAALYWGDWNDCPAAEYHVAALRSWRDRFGAELVSMGFDTLDLRVRQRPAGRDAAVALARELHLYCSDTIDQGFGTVNAYAASLAASDWWNFWWD